MKLTQEEACALFSYESGLLRRKASTGPRSIVGEIAGQRKTREGYFSVQIRGKAHKVHQLVFLMLRGFIPDEIDHINGDRSDNRIENLRAVTRSQNCANQLTQKRSVSGFKGVTRIRRNGKWRARIKVSQVEYFLGLFDTPEAAAAAYNQAASLHFGEFARTNQIAS